MTSCVVLVCDIVAIARAQLQCGIDPRGGYHTLLCRLWQWPMCVPRAVNLRLRIVLYCPKPYSTLSGAVRDGEAP